MKKTFKRVSLFLMTIICVMLSMDKVDALNKSTGTANITNNQFVYDFNKKGVILPSELVLGENQVTIPSTSTFASLDDVTISYKIFELSEADYTELKNLQDIIDAKASITSTDADVQRFTAILRDTTNDYYWCYTNWLVGKINFNFKSCDKKYYVLEVDVKGNGTDGNPHEYHEARVYEVQPNETNCSREEPTPNPSTGISTPYVVCGVIAGLSIAIILVNKKKKYL